MSLRAWRRAAALAGALLVALAVVVACASTRERHEDSIQGSVRAMERSPGGARETLAHLDALVSSMAERDEGDRAIVTQAMLERASGYTDKAVEKNPDEAPVLLARLGLMWSLAREPKNAEQAFRASVAARPTLEGLRGLMTELGRREAFDDVRRVCGDGASALPDAELPQHLQSCASAAHATSSTQAADWLSEADRARYDTLKQKQAAAHAAELKEREERMAQHAEREKKLGVCRATCDEKGAACKTQCRREQTGCVPACEEMAAACGAKCEAALP